VAHFEVAWAGARFAAEIWRWAAPAWEAWPAAAHSVETWVGPVRCAVETWLADCAAEIWPAGCEAGVLAGPVAVEDHSSPITAAPEWRDVPAGWAPDRIWAALVARVVDHSSRATVAARWAEVSVVAAWAVPGERAAGPSWRTTVAPHWPVTPALE
jgi:hypothetical protein